MTAVAGFLHRKTTDFNVHSWDNLLRAVNNARKQTEKLIDFEYSRVNVDVPNVSLSDGGDLGDAFIHGGDEDSELDFVDVKKVKRAFLAFTNGGLGTFPIGLMSRDRWLDKQQRRFERAVPTDSVSGIMQTGSPFVLIQMARQIYVMPADATTLSGDTITVYLDVYKWLDDYTASGEEEDFLLEHCFDWLQYATIQELNFFLKEDERVQLSQELVGRAWDAMVRWNSNIIGQEVEDMNVD